MSFWYAAKTELLLSQDLSSTTKGNDILNVLDNFSNRMNWIGESWLDARLMGLHLCSADSQVFKPMWKLCHQTPPLSIVSYTDSPFVLRCSLRGCCHAWTELSKSWISSKHPPWILGCSICSEDFGSDHISLLYHTEVRWLSRGNATRRLFELRDEPRILNGEGTRF